MVPDDGFGLQRLSGVGQLELDSNPLSQLKLRRQHRCHAAFSEIERASGDAGRGPGAEHGDVHGNGDGIARNAAPDAAQARQRVS